MKFHFDEEEQEIIDMLHDYERSCTKSCRNR